ncbi:MAG: transglutaminase domain-containing protein [Myxococcaceae bacterium]
MMTFPRPLFLLWLALAMPALALDAPVSDAVKAPRPAGGEWFGLYLLDKKVGYVFTDVARVPGALERVESVTELVFQAAVGNKQSERFHKERRVYEAKPGGRLLELHLEDRGDGGDKTVIGRSTPGGFEIIRKRPGHPDEKRVLPSRQERVEDADPARVALLREKGVQGFVTSPDDLEEHAARTTLSPTEERTLKGVKVKLRKAITVSEKDKVPVEAYVTREGATVEVRFGDTLRALAEPASVAKRLDRVEVFGLTRVVLPRPLTENARNVPGTARLVLSGLPAKFQRVSARQKFRVLSKDKVEVTLRAEAPRASTKASFPVRDARFSAYLKSSLLVESDHPDIRALSKRLLADEKDASKAVRKVASWVGENLAKEYGASADQASDVLRQMKGDCTEHSLLTVALLRAAGIPARRIDGLVYLVNEDKVPALYWHEWVEAWVGEWIQVDPTFKQPIADATHLGLGEEGNADITLLIGQLRAHDAG